MSLLRFLRDNAPFLSAGVLLTFLSSFGQTFFISIFSGEIRAAFDLSHGGWGAIYSAGTTASAIAMIWAGVATDHFRVRRLAPLIMVTLATACVLMAVLPTIWFLPIAIFLLRFAGQGMLGQIATVAMARWFVAARGRALSVASLGVAAGEATLPLLFVALLTIVDWRILWVAAAILTLMIVPVVYRLLRLERTPQSIANDPQSVGMNGLHWNRRDMLHHVLFWLILPALLAPAAFSTAFFFQQVHFAETKGWSHVALVGLFPVFTLFGIGAMLVSGMLVDRLGTPRLMPFLLLPSAAGFALMGQADSLFVAGLAMAMMGITQGANSTVPNAFWAEFYGSRHLGGIKSLATAAMVFGTAIGPGLSGYLIDAGYPFQDQMIWISGYFVFAAFLVGVGVSRSKASLPSPGEIDIIRS